MSKERDESFLPDDYSLLRGGDDFQERERGKRKREKRLSKKKRFDRRSKDADADQALGPAASMVNDAEDVSDWNNVDLDALSRYAKELYGKLARIGVVAKTDKFDQHFLVDEEAIHALVSSANITSGDSILEVGPGPGNLTKEIWNVCRDVRASLATIELDESFAPLLSEIPDSEKIHMRWGDALRLLQSSVKQHGVNKVVANIPYSILEPLLKEIHSSRSVQMAVLLVGKRYADRAIADFRDEDPKTEGFSKTSLFSQTRFSPEIIAEIPRESFLPPPRTESAIVRLNPRRGSNVDFMTVANAMIQRPTMQVRTILQNLLQQKFNKSKLSQINSIEDAKELTDIVPPRVDQLGLPEELLKSTIGSLTNQRLQTLLLKLDLVRKKRKRDRVENSDESDDE